MGTFHEIGKPSLDELLGLFGCETSHVGIADERAVHVAVAGDASLGGEFGNAIDAHLDQVSNSELQRRIRDMLIRQVSLRNRLRLVTFVTAVLRQDSRLILGRSLYCCRAKNGAGEEYSEGERF